MKSFFEEYGFVILAAIVAIILIAMATPIGDLVKIQISEVVNSFSSKTQSKLNATDGIIQVRVSTANNKITLEWDANKKEDVFKYSYKASNTKGEANWTNKTDVTINDKNRTVTIEKDSNDQPLANKTKVEYKIYDSNNQLVASGIATAKVEKDAITGGEDGTEISGITTGKVLTIEGKEYTVIENVQGTQYKVLATDMSERAFDDHSSNNYATSIIATYLNNDYYNSLPEVIRNAIVETSIQQKYITSKDGSSGSWVITYNETKTKDAGIHKVFIPSWDEVTKVYDSTKEGVKAYALNGWTWFRDAYYAYDSALLGALDNGELYSLRPNTGNVYVRPAFVLDLSKVTYTVK